MSTTSYVDPSAPGSAFSGTLARQAGADDDEDADALWRERVLSCPRPVWDGGAWGMMKTISSLNVHKNTSIKKPRAVQDGEPFEDDCLLWAIWRRPNTRRTQEATSGERGKRSSAR
ncbi:hypothetical protein CF335_g5723 [Tilletia laevis]|nr:hypothetical protein CF335_g5723 [Tilletia laevis]